jgi:ankyrin repeat protein
MSSERSRAARQRIDAHLEKGGIVNDVIQPLFGTTFMHKASLSGDVENVRYLLNRGAEVNARDINGGTPIISAVVGCHLDVATLLIEHGADPKMRDKTIGTAIELARRTKQKKILKILKRR